MRRLLSLSLLLIVTSTAAAQKEFGFDNRKPSGQPYLKPAESVARMKVADGFEVKLFAAEPDVVNPIAMTVDEKGRVWVIESFEYPKRTPKGKMPRDRIVILEDTKGIGVCDKRTVFAEGKDFPVPFDLASGIEVGNGGVYVGAPPYLFFIENKNDKPGKFEILLKGFGSQDTHEMLNTFQWGPDGWLYGLHGVFTNSEVEPASGGRKPPDDLHPASGGRKPPDDLHPASGGRKPPDDLHPASGGRKPPDDLHPASGGRKPPDVKLDGADSKKKQGADSTKNQGADSTKNQGADSTKNQGANAPRSPVKIDAGVWRFHPKTKKFEVFAEGTSNPWGMDWRNTDGQFIVCCCVIPHLFHIVPGGSYKRQAGQSSNPYAYGEIKEICDHTFHKESGWAHAGLISLDTPLMPEKYRNSVIFGSIHGCSIKQNILKPNGSTYTASRGDDFLVSGDKNFRPINLRWGPNGEIYCIDWHDQNPCHQANPEDLDYEHGRVFRIQTKGLKIQKAEDLNQKTSGELAKLVIDDPNPFRYRSCMRLLFERQRDGVFPGEQLKIAQETLNSLSNSIRFRGTLLFSSIGISMLHPGIWHNDPVVRAFAVRRRGVRSTSDIRELFDLSTKEVSASVRRERASLVPHMEQSAYTMLLIHDLMQHKEDAKDPLIPQLLWTAYEKQISKSLGKELDWLRDNCKNNPLITETIIPRTMRRLVATGKAEDLAACVAFLGDLKDATAKQRALEGLVLALQNRQVDAPEKWNTVRVALLKDSNKDIVNLTNKLAINFRDVEAIKRALGIAADVKRSLQERIDAVRDLALAKPPTAVAPLLKIAKMDELNELRAEAIRALAAFDDPVIARELISGYAGCARNLKGEIVNVLAGRKEWARQLLDAVGAKTIERTELNDNTILRIQALKDKNLDAQVEKVWGRIRSTPAELNELINKTRGQLAEGRASFAKGKIAFDNHCAKCHKFDGRGSEVGPNIEGAGRDIEYLLVNVLDPNRVIGAPYFMRTITKLNGQSEQGLLHAEDDQSITLKTENAVLKVIAKKDIETLRVQEKSLMPEGFGNNMKIQEFRDLIRYVMADPFMTEATVYVSRSPSAIEKLSPIVGVSGRIQIPEGDLTITIQASAIAPEVMKAKLLLGIREDAAVTINGKQYPIKGSGTVAQPDQVGVEVELAKGENKIEIAFRTKGKGEAVYARFHDPDRKLRYPEPK